MKVGQELPREIEIVKLLEWDSINHASHSLSLRFKMIQTNRTEEPPTGYSGILWDRLYQFLSYADAYRLRVCSCRESRSGLVYRVSGRTFYVQVIPDMSK
ncbi:hypothetical protein M413DRAFT_290924 [Hebeloma cylindrosporum]|uniref:Uncharacterized protein n=1 Tax=Hebeloma cylindrosporum TaxID=76867 RepID=A0A0C2XEW6_HEBCY|nr:hypothetical protein M413DRAFT_290924 [Hebeloma cylindrosporum h7]